MLSVLTVKPRFHSLSARTRGVSIPRIKINGVPALRSSHGPATWDYVLRLRHNHMLRSSLERSPEDVCFRFPRCLRRLATSHWGPFPERGNRDLGLTRIAIAIEHMEGPPRGLFLPDFPRNISGRQGGVKWMRGAIRPGFADIAKAGKWFPAPFFLTPLLRAIVA